ncbi:MAG: Hsp70 family protein [Prevotellaceae bacterium]|jgi:molecular chaperone DnaK (HSP70)|nr:Hsp70 family protein [Prevotellaceae bacterium]
MDNTRNVFGIDLGTTYSCVAQVDSYDQAVVIKNKEGQSTTPSVVYFDEKSDKVIVGDPAREESKINPHNTVSFVKRSMSKDDAFNGKIKFPKGLMPTVISSYILTKIVADANEKRQGNEVKKVVITCPAYFGEKERLRTKQAGEAASLEVLAIINEPTAAAIAYGQGIKEIGSKYVLVYDLGGGTFDITLLKISKDDSGKTDIAVVATDGNAGLGGYNWDKRFAEYLLQQYNKEKGTKYILEEGTALFNEMMLVAEEQKKRLSNKDSINAVIDLEAGRAKIENVTLAKFDELTESLLDETIEKVNVVLNNGEEIGVDRNQVKEILLVGGSTYMPQVKKRIEKEFRGVKIDQSDPDESVAKGAAIYALKLSYDKNLDIYISGETDEKPKAINTASMVNAVNVTSKNYGIGYTDSKTGEDRVLNLLFANSPLDYCRADSGDFLSIREDNTTGLIIPVYESDPEIKDKTYLAEMGVKLDQQTMPLPPNIKKGTPTFMVFELDSEGFLHVHGEVQGVLGHIDFKLRLTGVMDEKELQKAKAMVANSNVE